MRGLVTAVGAVIALSACGGSVNGTVAGASLAVADSVFFVNKDSAGKTKALIVVLSDKPNVCTSLKANREAKNSTGIIFQLIRLSANAEILAPDVADYTVTEQISAAGNWGFADFAKTDSNCTSVLASSATSGKSGVVKLTAIKADTGGVASGTFDVTFGSQNDKVTGSFNSTYCDLSTLGTNPNCE